MTVLWGRERAQPVDWLEVIDEFRTGLLGKLLENELREIADAQPAV